MDVAIGDADNGLQFLHIFVPFSYLFWYQITENFTQSSRRNRARIVLDDEAAAGRLCHSGNLFVAGGAVLQPGRDSAISAQRFQGVHSCGSPGFLRLRFCNSDGVGKAGKLILRSG